MASVRSFVTAPNYWLDKLLGLLEKSDHSLKNSLEQEEADINIPVPRLRQEGDIMHKEIGPGSPKSLKSGRSQTSGDFELLVGKEVYATWIAMLKRLGPSGRTHRLSVVVAGMLYYASGQEGDKNNTVRRLIDEAEGADYDETETLLIPLVEQLFKDAGVEWKRKNSKGQSYSIAEESVREFFNWDLMPWE